MTKKLPPFHTLAAFEAIARHQSFAKAAEELSITQSAVSHRIAKLEAHLGVPCIARGRGLVSLTAQGAQLLGGVLEAMSALESACERLRERGRLVVKLSVGPAFARGWLIDKLGSFYREHAEIDLEIVASKVPDAQKLSILESGKADLAIRYGTEANWRDFPRRRLFKSDAFAVCSPAYASSIGPLKAPADLARASLLRLAGQPWKPWFLAAGLPWDEPTTGPLFSDAALMLDSAANGHGIALARRALVDFEINLGRLTRVFDVGLASESAYYAVWRRTSGERPEIHSFLTWLVAVAADEDCR